MRFRPEFWRIRCGDVFIHSLIEGGYHSWRQLNACTTRSDERTSSCSREPDGSFNSAGGSPNLGASAKFIRNYFCQWTKAISVILNSTCNYVVGVAFCIIYTNIYFKYYSLKFNLNLSDHRYNSVQTNLCFHRTIQHGNEFNVSYVSINGIKSFVEM